MVGRDVFTLAYPATFSVRMRGCPARAGRNEASSSRFSWLGDKTPDPPRYVDQMYVCQDLNFLINPFDINT